MHNPNYKAKEAPNEPKEHDMVKLNEYYKEDPVEPGDPDGPVIKIMEEEISKNNHKKNKTNNSSVDLNIEEHHEKVAHPPQNPKAKRISSRKKKYYLLGEVFLILLVVLVIILIFFRSTIIGEQYNSVTSYNETLSTDGEFINATTTIPRRAILTNETAQT
uniref:Uncharacterized protein n=1 Tax=Acrobeloides nanus TaxID=290746 RepID=A0A914EDP0_9BILA